MLVVFRSASKHNYLVKIILKMYHEAHFVLRCELISCLRLPIPSQVWQYLFPPPVSCWELSIPAGASFGWQRFKRCPSGPGLLACPSVFIPWAFPSPTWLVPHRSLPSPCPGLKRQSGHAVGILMELLQWFRCPWAWNKALDLTLRWNPLLLLLT